jgi:hypothetical protein
MCSARAWRSTTSRRPSSGRETAGSWPPSAVEMLLAAWGAAVGHPAYVTTTVADLTGAPARSFRDWVAAYAERFRNVG